MSIKTIIQNRVASIKYSVETYGVKETIVAPYRYFWNKNKVLGVTAVVVDVTIVLVFFYCLAKLIPLVHV